MLPTKLTAEDKESIRRLYKIVRLDRMEDVPGLILAAYVESGLCILRIGHDAEGPTEEHNLGQGGLRIIRR